MSEPSRPCVDCGTPVRRRSPVGAIPNRYPACAPTPGYSRRPAQQERPCVLCGEPVARRDKTGSVPERCEACLPVVRRTCLTCAGPVARRGLSYAHYCSAACKPSCDAPECREPFKYHTDTGRLCPTHYVRWKKYGDVTVVKLVKDYSPAPETCRQCEGPRGAGYGKWFCSARCEGRHSRGVDESLEWPCVACASTISIRESRRDAKKCKRCRTMRPCWPAARVAARDGVICKLCGDHVDMTLPGSSMQGPSVDHIMPRAHYGPNTPENLQLVHRVCNSRKQDRIMT